MMNLQTEQLPRLATLLTVRQVAEILNCSVRTVWRLSDAGRIPPPVRLGGLVRWQPRAIDKWLAEGCPTLPARRKRR